MVKWKRQRRQRRQQSADQPKQAWWRRHWAAGARVITVGLIATFAMLHALSRTSASPANTFVSMAESTGEVAYAEVSGGGPLGRSVVLVHGSPADAASWNAMLRRAEDIDAGRIVMLDRPGFGHTTVPSTDELAVHVAAIRAVINAAGLERPVLVGHSYGGPVVLRAAAEFGDDLGGIVILAGACDPEMDDPKWFRRAVDAAGPVIPPTWATSNRELLAMNEENRAMRPMLADVRCPVGIVHGTWDPVCPHDPTIDYLQGELVNAAAVDVRSLPRRGHNVHISAVDDVVDLVNGMLRTPLP